MGKGKTKAPAKEKPAETEKVNVFTIPNGSIGVLYTLLNIPMHGNQSRARNRIASLLKSRMSFCQDEQHQIWQKYAQKDAKGKFVAPPQGSEELYVFEAGDREKASADLLALMEAPYDMDLSNGVRGDLVLMRPFILESKVPMDLVHGIDYDIICQAFEAI